MADDKIKFNWKEIEPGAGWQKVTLRFDKPKDGIGTKRDGTKTPYSLLGVEVNGEDAGWFLSDEEKELLTKLNVKKGSELLIKTEFYRRHSKDGKAINDVYGVLEYNNKEYTFGKETNGEKEKVEPKQSEKEKLPEIDKGILLRDLYKECIIDVFAMLWDIYKDPDNKKKPNEQLTGSEVVRMINTYFMQRAKVI